MNPNFTFVPDLAGLMEEVPPDSIVSRTFYQGEDAKAILFGFAPTQELSEHTAARPAILHVLQGEGRLTLGEASRQVQSGAWVHMPAHLPHSVYAETVLVMLLLLL